MKSKNKLFIFFAITLLQYLAANFAHPITPTIIKNLNLKDYMFGLAFAAMSFTNFLFSPFWGKMRDYYSPRKLLFLGCAGYAVGQFLFSIMKTEGTILIARCFSGFFVGAISVSTLVYIIDVSEKEERGKNLATLAIIQSIGAAFGYMIGGFMGVYSIRLTFAIQSLTLIVSGVLYFLLLQENKTEQYETMHTKILFKEANPFKSFLGCSVFMTKSFLVLFLVVMFANLGTNAFDQCFNYYLKDQFDFSSAYNGMLKAIIGIITLVANSTICMWIMRKKNIKKATSIVLSSCALSIIIMLNISDFLPFIIVCIVFFSFNAIYIPLLQDCVAKESTNKNNNLVMGFYNAIKSLGMIGGALIAGFMYGYGEKIPFVFAGICFVLAAIFLVLNKKISQKA